MASILDQLLKSDNGVSNGERGIGPVRLAQATTGSAAAKSAARFNHREPTAEDFEMRKFAVGLARLGSFVIPNAARHLDHYLEGGEIGSIGKDARGQLLRNPVALEIDVETVLREIPGLRTQVLNSVNELKNDLIARWTAGQRPTVVRGKAELAGATTLTSQDWFYALGRFSFQIIANVQGSVTQTAGKVSANVTFRARINDYYDWDQDAVVLPIPNLDTGEDIVIPDGAMRDLHDCGLAREYPIHGEHVIRTESVSTL